MFNNNFWPEPKKFAHIRERGRRVRNRTDSSTSRRQGERNRGDYTCGVCGVLTYKPFCIKHIEKMPYLAQNAAMFAVFSLFPGI